jgi:hypothetical protein
VYSRGQKKVGQCLFFLWLLLKYLFIYHSKPGLLHSILKILRLVLLFSVRDCTYMQKLHTKSMKCDFIVYIFFNERVIMAITHDFMSRAEVE